MSCNEPINQQPGFTKPSLESQRHLQVDMTRFEGRINETQVYFINIIAYELIVFHYVYTLLEMSDSK